MFLRSLGIAVSLAALSVTSAQAGWFSRDKPRTEEAPHQHASKGKAKQNAPTRAYRKTMHGMHKTLAAPHAGNADVDFARQMIPHHQAAIEMARTQLKYGRDAKLKAFNDWVIQAQTQEVAMMQNWLRRKDNGASYADAPDYFGEATMRMHHAMAIRYTGNADVDYARGMIAHHQGAVEMAAILLAEGADPELNDLANDVYSSQSYEIAWLQDWLDAHGHKGQ